MGLRDAGLKLGSWGLSGQAGGGFERDQVYCVMLGPGRDERRLES